MRPYKVILAQLIGPALLAVTFLWTTDAAVARSVLAGGLISALSNGYFAVQAFRYQGAENADKVVRSFLKGEIGKIVIAILLFALSFNFLEDLNVVALFSGFLFAHLIGIWVTGWMTRGPTSNSQ
ncbi:MAG: F0F1 ATP synthase subunit I [Gammaproteobacteria bacterium]|nr:ATP synthase subunit I [Gammaproteobacteria bacterium]MDE0480140.1 ATP synthase subunit I [Gammaproteobacteria bacterium]MXY89587.1 F0F1 ATP synthase subunit I [Gammaproteobacteria bacterium]MXZ33352.1 F0F1 ATP synthase subunit I [Gammaproteobacteria bacterium]MYA35890.1 F0F1 ATP synthase subunit I [Gammaproteobacteria bacterium]